MKTIQGFTNGPILKDNPFTFFAIKYYIDEISHLKPQLTKSAFNVHFIPEKNPENWCSLK
ncbi:hypothetical protein BON23_5166 [Saccharomyces cerevisiae]|nr:hypothetical protein BON23_5166 [Saccharomyces cerevisiae]